MLNPFREKNEPDAIEVTFVDVQPEVPEMTEAPFSAVAEKVPVGIEELMEEEKALLGEKQRLLDVIAELESRLSIEIERKRSAIGSLRTEVSELQKACEILANALEIPVLK